MATRTMDLSVGSRRGVLTAALGRIGTAIEERRAARRSMRRLMADRVTGRETGARI